MPTTFHTTWTAAVTTPNWGTPRCYLTKPALPGVDEQPALTLCGDGIEAISHPSPMESGGLLQLRCTSAEPCDAQVQVNDIAGRIVLMVFTALLPAQLRCSSERRDGRPVFIWSR